MGFNSGFKGLKYLSNEDGDIFVEFYFVYHVQLDIKIKLSQNSN